MIISPVTPLHKLASMATDKTTKSLPVHEMDTNILFEKFTVDEIREIEKKTRADIERKKEDLRTMVGERYRDLIEAADTITDMKNSAQNIMNSMSKMEEMCKELKQSHMIKGSSYHQRSRTEHDQKRKQEVKFYGVASQIKLLLDMPEKIWSALDSSNYLVATRHYLLSRHIHTSLQLDSQQSPQLLSWFPVLTRQWAAISHFRSTILQGCRAMLKEPVTTDKVIAECLCSIILLEDSTPRQVFNEFLLARTTAVQQLFHPNQQNASVKEQICTVVRLITTTVHQIHGVFYSGSSNNEDNVPNNLLVTILTEVTSQKQQDSGLLEIHGSISVKCLPKSVTEFCPSLRSHATPVSVQHLHDNCQQWINTCINDVKSGVGKLLGFVNTVKRLADIRDAVWELIAQDDTMVVWMSVCQKILNTSLHMWQGFLQPLFLDRVKALMKYQLDTTTEMTKRQIAKVVMEIGNVEDSTLQADLNMASYIWTENKIDIPPNMSWTTASHRMMSENPGGLMMKAKAYTPIVQSLCNNFDERLKVMLEDSMFYIQPGPSEDEQTNDSGPFDRYADKADLLNHLKFSCEQCLKELLDYINDQLKLWKKSLSEIPDKSINIITQNKILLVGRLCTGLCELAPSLQKCILGQSSTDVELIRYQKKHAASKAIENTAWSKSQENLADCQATAYKIWVDHLSSSVLKEFDKNLHCKEGPEVVTSCTRWDEVDIQEETEDGKKISSKIRVPMQASWYVHSLFYYMCQEINRIGGHALTRSVLQNLVYKVSDGMMIHYENLIKESRKKKDQSCFSLCQQRALQLLFDVKFLLQIIPRKDDLQESKLYQQRAQRVIDGLEEKVDPFDLDVFSPFIQSHLLKQAQRSSVLYGALTSLDRLGLYTGSRLPQSSQQEQHNVLPLTNCQNRFSLLPLSTQPSRSMFPQPVLSHSLQKISDMSSSLTEKAAAVIPEPSPHKDTSTSFYNKLGSMSSMTELSNWFSNIGSKS